MSYQQFDWRALDFVRQNLFNRLIEPLQRMQQSLQNRTELSATQIQQHQQIVAALLNTLAAWSTLVQYKQNPNQLFQTQRFESHHLPIWLKTYLERHTTLRAEFDLPLQLHVETFLEGLLLLYLSVRQINPTVHIQMTNAPLPKYGIYVRLVFSQVDEPIASMGELIERLGDQAVTLAAAQDMMTINRAKIRLQNNKQTGQQALSIFIAAQEDETEPQPISLSTGIIVLDHKPESIENPPTPIPDNGENKNDHGATASPDLPTKTFSW